MDRNSNIDSGGDIIEVALLAEGVDRNSAEHRNLLKTGRSPSSRRAWIEIEWEGYRVVLTFVALLAEGVDRNF